MESLWCRLHSSEFMLAFSTLAAMNLSLLRFSKLSVVFLLRPATLPPPESNVPR